jgi:hypothetical protein
MITAERVRAYQNVAQCGMEEAKRELRKIDKLERVQDINRLVMEAMSWSELRTCLRLILAEMIIDVKS